MHIEWVVGLVCAVVALIILVVVVVVLLLTRQRGKDKGAQSLSCFIYSVNINSFEYDVFGIELSYFYKCFNIQRRMNKSLLSKVSTKIVTWEV